MNAQAITLEGLRGGPSFGLTMELGQVGDDLRSTLACEAFWEGTSVYGPWTETSSFGDISRLASVVSKGVVSKTCYGQLNVANITTLIPFTAYLISEAGSVAYGDGARVSHLQSPAPELSDWLSIGISTAVLDDFYQVDDNWVAASQPWLLDLCAAFANLADYVHSKVSLCSGAMGEEISGCWRHPTSNRRAHAYQEYPPMALMSAEVVETRGGVLLPRDLWNELRPNVEPITLPSGLLYVSPRLNAPLLGA
jgi:hypothetical protein